MNIQKHLKILGTGKCLPKKCIQSVDLEKQLGLPTGWALKYSGVKERRHVVNETNAELAIAALNQALNRAGLMWDDIDLLINSAVTFDYILPFQASYILNSVKSEYKRDIASMDINASCLSFVSAFEVAAALLDKDKYKKIAIVSSEVASKGLNPADMESMTLFGDGAAAVIIGTDPDCQSGVIRSLMKTYSEGFDYSIIKGGGNKYFSKDYPYDPYLHSFHMEGKKLLKLAKRKIPGFFEEFFRKGEFTFKDVDILIPHQASKAGLAVFMHLYPDYKGIVYSNLETHGNCISASIPMCFHDAIEEGVIVRGKTCLLTGTAAGFAIGGILIKY